MHAPSAPAIVSSMAWLVQANRAADRPGEDTGRGPESASLFMLQPAFAQHLATALSGYRGVKVTTFHAGVSAPASNSSKARRMPPTANVYLPECKATQFCGASSMRC